MFANTQDGLCGMEVLGLCLDTHQLVLFCLAIISKTIGSTAAAPDASDAGVFVGQPADMRLMRQPEKAVSRCRNHDTPIL